MRRLAILLPALAALGLPAAAGAAEPWGPARTLAGAGGPFTPVVAVDDRGYALAGWERVNGRSDVLAARRTPTAAAPCAPWRSPAPSASAGCSA